MGESSSRKRPKASTKPTRENSVLPSRPKVPPVASVGNTTMLPTLPLEIQLQVLKLCLTTATPFIDFGYSQPLPTFITFRTVKNERRGQKEVNFALLGVSPSYRAEGLKILWRDNQFIYSGRFDGRHPQIVIRPCPVNLWRWESLPPTLDQLIRPTVWTLDHKSVRKLPRFETLHHLILRHDTSNYPQHLMESVLFAIQIPNRFPSLSSLRLNVVPHGVEQPIWGGSDWFWENYDKICRRINWDPRWKAHNSKYSANPRPAPRLRKFTLTGIMDDDVSLLSVVYVSSIVRSDGFIGVGFWDEAKTYAVPNLHGKGHLRSYDDVIPQSIPVNDMKAWIWEQCQPYLDIKDQYDWRSFFSLPPV